MNDYTLDAVENPRLQRLKEKTSLYNFTASTLEALHDAHQGIERSKRRARQTVWWPGITSDIVNTVGNCAACQERRSSLPQEPMATEPLPSRIFEDVSSDLFSHAGRDYFVYVDRLSGWPIIHQLPRGDTTSRQIIKALREAFVSLGVPVRLRTDGGPQYKSREVANFLKRWGVQHVISTPYYPQSNGHAESAVKLLKHLVSKTTEGGSFNDMFYRGLLELRNTPRADRRSPAQMVFGHPIRSCVPAHHSTFAVQWQQHADECDSKAAKVLNQAQRHYNSSAHTLPSMKIGVHVRIQDPISKRWDKLGTIVGVGYHRDYLVKTPSDRVLWRNRRFIRSSLQLPLEAAGTPSADHQGRGGPRRTPSEEPATAPRRRVRFQLEPESVLRRGARQRRPPNRLGFDDH
ncbi:uncharacterized protein K02A2.6-like [Amphibalanus amphitrite]|uniref:uncharacterized protein K02A2.6-like n=1 Tax=Amphibalanus amphitrite TaxID=1232801 RepID=UPI001C917D68|nr:uncharacterized protein K02A2.6-like [Amphibalanus amphitrite]